MWPNPQFSADLVKFAGETLKGKLHFRAVEFLKPSGLTVTYEIHLEASNSHLMNARPNQNKIIHSLAT